MAAGGRVREEPAVLAHRVERRDARRERVLLHLQPAVARRQERHHVQRCIERRGARGVVDRPVAVPELVPADALHGAPRGLVLALGDERHQRARVVERVGGQRGALGPAREVGERVRPRLAHARAQLARRLLPPERRRRNRRAAVSRALDAHLCGEPEPARRSSAGSRIVWRQLCGTLSAAFSLEMRSDPGSDAPTLRSNANSTPGDAPVSVPALWPSTPPFSSRSSPSSAPGPRSSRVTPPTSGTTAGAMPIGGATRRIV